MNQSSSSLYSRFSAPDQDLFDALKDRLRGLRFADDDLLKERAGRASTLQHRVFGVLHRTSQTMVEKSMLIMNQNLRKNYLNSVKNARTICKFQYNGIYVSKKNIGDITIVSPFLIIP